MQPGSVLTGVSSNIIKYRHVFLKNIFLPYKVAEIALQVLKNTLLQQNSIRSLKVSIH